MKPLHPAKNYSSTLGCYQAPTQGFPETHWGVPWPCCPASHLCFIAIVALTVSCQAARLPGYTAQIFSWASVPLRGIQYWDLWLGSIGNGFSDKKSFSSNQTELVEAASACHPCNALSVIHAGSDFTEFPVHLVDIILIPVCTECHAFSTRALFKSLNLYIYIP